MLELSLSKLKGVFGGCYCYCFKYPFSHKHMLNPSILIGERENKSICEEDCYPNKKEELGYLGYSGCISYIRDEMPINSRFLERADWLDKLFAELGASGYS